MLCKFSQLASHSVVEADAKRQQQIGLVDRIVGVNGSVHSQHVERLRVCARENAETHDSHGNRDARAESEACELFRGFAVDAATADVEHGALGTTDRSNDLADLLGTNRRNLWTIARQVHRRVEVDVFKRERIQLDILWEVNKDRSRTAG